MSDNNMAYVKKSEAIASGKGSCLLSGAVMVYNDKEIFASTNRTLDDDDPTAHAAVIAIRKTRLKQHSFLLNDYILYLSEKPCNMCITAIAQAGINKIYYLEEQKLRYMQLSPECLKKAYTIWDFKH